MTNQFVHKSKNALIDICKYELELEDWQEIYGVCSHFGCGKKLSLIESIAGSKCTFHMIEENFMKDHINYFCLKIKNKN